MKIYVLSLLCAFMATSQLGAQNMELDEFGAQTFKMTEGDTTYVMKQYFFGLIKKGPIRNQDEETTASLQEAHLKYMGDLSEQGKINIAGPFGGDNDHQGIVIYNVPNFVEARELANGDPMVKVGRLVIEVLPLWAAKGSILK